MRRKKIILLCVISLVLLAGCGKKTGAVNTDTTAATTTETTNTSTVTSTTNTFTATVMIDGVIYESTGYISSAIGCGNMDGKITSVVEGADVPTKNDQSNFGVGYEYQRSSEGQVIVVMNDMRVIFRDPKHSFAFDIPEEVLNFNAEVLEVRDGSLLVSFISAPELFMPSVTGKCVVRTNPEIMKEDVAVGDTVRVWFDGLVQEIYPPILPNVYRIVKEKEEPVKEEKTAGETPEEFEYSQNADGTWNYDGRDYKHRLMLTGTLPNAAVESFYVVLSDFEDVTFKEASDLFLSSTLNPEEEKKFVVPILGVYTPECEVPSAKVLVYIEETTPSGVTVCFDQYDNTVETELLTGEFFVLEKKDGDNWVEVKPIISNAAFNDIGIMLRKGGITRKAYDWEWLYGRQEPGQYRIRIQVVDGSVHEAAAVFAITE